MNTLVLCTSGWDDDPREVYLIPAARRFYRSLHARWPYALYFLNLDHDSLRIFAFCCLQNLTAISIDGRPEAGVEIDLVELARFLSGSFPGMNLLCEQAGMSEDEIFDRTRKVFDYFQLPFLA